MAFTIAHYAYRVHVSRMWSSPDRIGEALRQKVAVPCAAGERAAMERVIARLVLATQLDMRKLKGILV